MFNLRWAFENAAARDAGAIAPSGLQSLTHAIATQPRSHDLAHDAELGRVVSPADCPPVRLVAGYGYEAACPGDVVLRRSEHHRRERHFGDRKAHFGLAEIEGDPWPHSDSGLVASWISGSEFVKVQTGILIYFSLDTYLFQGPLPNRDLEPAPGPDVMAGLEYPHADRQHQVEGGAMAYSCLNAIVRLPPLGEVTRIRRGDPLVWFYPVPKRSAGGLERHVPDNATGLERSQERQ